MEKISVELRSLSKEFNGNRVVKEVNLAVRAGELVSLLGPSGCGKTTTLRMIGGLVVPSSGSVTIAGRPMAGVPPHQRNVSMLFQNYALFPHMTVAENVGFGLRMRKAGRAEIARRVDEMLAMVQLDGYQKRPPQALSGGQQQRVALARSLITNPSVLLLDEPFGALDTKLRTHMQGELRDLQQRMGITTILVTHDQHEALTLSDRVAVMNDGRVHQFADPETIYHRPESRFVATFIGQVNLIAGKIKTLALSQAEVVTTAGVTVSVPVRSAGLQIGADVEVSIRPERIRVSGEAVPRGDGPSVPARLLRSTFHGSEVRQYFESEHGQRFVAVCHSAIGGSDRLTLQPGASARLEWEPEDCSLIAG